MNADAAPGRMQEGDLDRLPPWWRACVELAWEAQCAGSLPIGAVVVAPDGRVLARGRNRLHERHADAPHATGTPYLTGTPLAHAEVNALLALGDDAPHPRPTLYTTMEPCPLCMGAARMTGMARVVFAARDPWAGCSSMADTVPYLRERGPTVAGPEAALERPLIAWQTAVMLRWYGEDEPFLRRWREVLPDAVAAGARLAADGALEALARGDASAAEAWSVVRAALGA